MEQGIARYTRLSMAWLENNAEQFIEPYGGCGRATLPNTPMPETLNIFSLTEHERFALSPMLLWPWYKGLSVYQPVR